VTSANGVVRQTCTGSCTLTLTPGIYSSVSITQSGTDTVILGSGTYVFTGVFSITGGGDTTITNGSGGVVLYFTCGSGTTPSACSSGGRPGGSLSLTGTGTTELDLSPMTTGPFAGLTVYYDRNDTSPLSMTASGGSTFEGSVYAKSSAVTITVGISTATLESMIDVKSLTVTSTGGAGLDVDYNPNDNVPLGSDTPELCSMAANNC